MQSEKKMNSRLTSLAMYCTCNVVLWSVRVAIVVVEKQ